MLVSVNSILNFYNSQFQTICFSSDVLPLSTYGLQLEKCNKHFPLEVVKVGTIQIGDFDCVDLLSKIFNYASLWNRYKKMETKPNYAKLSSASIVIKNPVDNFSDYVPEKIT